MKKFFLLLIALISLSVLLSSCGKSVINETTTTTTTISTTEQTTLTTTTTTEPESTTEDKGKMVCSDSPDNPYLNSVVKKYGVDPSRLVAYYNENGTSDGNLVFEFDGSTDSNGNPIRTYSTMANMYAVDADYTSHKATGTKSSGNEYSTLETYAFKLLAEKAIFPYFGNDIQNA